jgi:hypothetical protein
LIELGKQGDLLASVVLNQNDSIGEEEKLNAINIFIIFGGIKLATNLAMIYIAKGSNYYRKGDEVQGKEFLKKGLAVAEFAAMRGDLIPKSGKGDGFIYIFFERISA